MPAVILTIGAVMTFVSLLYSPETKDLELDEVARKNAHSRPPTKLSRSGARS